MFKIKFWTTKRFFSSKQLSNIISNAQAIEQSKKLFNELNQFMNQYGHESGYLIIQNLRENKIEQFCDTFRDKFQNIQEYNYFEQHLKQIAESDFENAFIIMTQLKMYSLLRLFSQEISQKQLVSLVTHLILNNESQDEIQFFKQKIITSSKQYGIKYLFLINDLQGFQMLVNSQNIDLNDIQDVLATYDLICSSNLHNENLLEKVFYKIQQNIEFMNSQQLRFFLTSCKKGRLSLWKTQIQFMRRILIQIFEEKLSNPNYNIFYCQPYFILFTSLLQKAQIDDFIILSQCEKLSILLAQNKKIYNKELINIYKHLRRDSYLCKNLQQELHFIFKEKQQDLEQNSLEFLKISEQIGIQLNEEQQNIFQQKSIERVKQCQNSKLQQQLFILLIEYFINQIQKNQIDKNFHNEMIWLFKMKIEQNSLNEILWVMNTVTNIRLKHLNEENINVYKKILCQFFEYFEKTVLKSQQTDLEQLLRLLVIFIEKNKNQISGTLVDYKIFTENSQNFPFLVDFIQNISKSNQNVNLSNMLVQLNELLSKNENNSLISVNYLKSISEKQVMLNYNLLRSSSYLRNSELIDVDAIQSNLQSKLKNNDQNYEEILYLTNFLVEKKHNALEILKNDLEGFIMTNYKNFSLEQLIKCNSLKPILLNRQQQKQIIDQTVNLIDDQVNFKSVYDIVMGFDLKNIDKSSFTHFMIKISQNIDYYDKHHIMKLVKKIRQSQQDITILIKSIQLNFDNIFLKDFNQHDLIVILQILEEYHLEPYRIIEQIPVQYYSLDNQDLLMEIASFQNSIQIPFDPHLMTPANQYFFQLLNNFQENNQQLNQIEQYQIPNLMQKINRISIKISLDIVSQIQYLFKAYLQNNDRLCLQSLITFTQYPININQEQKNQIYQLLKLIIQSNEKNSIKLAQCIYLVNFYDLNELCMDLKKKLYKQAKIKFSLNKYHFILLLNATISNKNESFSIKDHWWLNQLENYLIQNHQSFTSYELQSIYFLYLNNKMASNQLLDLFEQKILK